MTKISLSKEELKAMISELEQKEYELSSEIEGINFFLEQSPARKYVNLVQKNGWHKGEIKELTPKQFKEIMGYDPPKAIQKPNGNVYWEYTFDQLATEFGYESDEAFKNAVEDCADALKKLRSLRDELRRVKSELKSLRGNGQNKSSKNPAQGSNEKEKESLVDRIWNWLPPYAKTSESLTGFLFYVLFNKKPIDSWCHKKVRVRERTRTKPLPGPAIVAMDQDQDQGAT